MQNEQHNKIDSFFRHGLEKGRVKPRADLWDQISGELAGQQNQGKKRKAGLLFLSIAASVVLLFGVGLTLILRQPASPEAGSFTFNFAPSSPSSIAPIPDSKASIGNDQAFASSGNPTTDRDAAQVSAVSPVRVQPVSRRNVFRFKLNGTDKAGAQYEQVLNELAQLDGGADLQGASNSNGNSLFERVQYVNALSSVPEAYPSLTALSGLEPVEDNSDVQPSSDARHLMAALQQPLPDNGSQFSSNSLVPSAGINGLMGEKRGRRKKRNRRFKVGGQFSPEYAFAMNIGAPKSEFSPGSESFSNSPQADVASVSQNTQKDTPPETSMGTAYSTGVRMGYAFNDRIELQSGVLYGVRNSSANQEVLSYRQNDLGDLEEQVTDFQVRQEFNFLEIPMLVRYNVIAREKFNYYLSSGVSANLFLNHISTSQLGESDPDQTVLLEREKTVQPSQLNLVLGTGVEYRLLDRVSLNLEPSIRYGALTSAYSFRQDNPAVFSVNTGLNYSF